MRPEVVCIGLATADTIVSLPRWPSPDGRVEADAIVRAFGGPAATAAVAISRLGRSVAVVGAVGGDAAGRAIRDALVNDGVDVSLLGMGEGASAESVILLDRSSDTRTILHAPGARLGALDDAARRACRDAAWVHTDHAGHALVSGIEPERLSVDAGHAIEGLDLRGIGLYAPSRTALLGRFPGRSVGAAVRAALSEGALRVAVTLGEDGALAADGGAAWRVPGVALEVASTLGAGDVFHGALLASLLDGMALPDATRRANAAAALSCRGLDGRSAIPDAAELEAALAGAPAVEPLVLEGLA